MLAAKLHFVPSLEDRVRRVSGTMRVNAQLIAKDRDEQLSAETG